MKNNVQMHRPKKNTSRIENVAYGMHILKSRHQQIRRLKRIHSPSYHGFRIWPSSWLLIDFLKHQGLHEGTRILDVGCGWGLTGIYCAKHYDAVVTGVDIDPEVFPYLQLHANINKVEISTMNQGLADLEASQLEEFDVLIGTDICFWNRMVESLKRLIDRAMGTGIQTIIIADPGRTPFEELGRYYVESKKGNMRNWAVDHPHSIQGRILKISLVNY